MLTTAPVGNTSSRVAVVSRSSPHTTYSSFSVRSNHVLGKSIFGPLRLGRDGVPLLSGLVMASSISVKFGLPSLAFLYLVRL